VTQRTHQWRVRVPNTTSDEKCGAV
jgi:hypothetical protein